MGNKNKVIVNILGQDYPLMSDDDRDYMQKVSYLVDDRMREISKANSKLGKTMVAVLTALNLADDYVKASDEKIELEAQVENLLKAIEENSFSDGIELADELVDNIDSFADDADDENDGAEGDKVDEEVEALVTEDDNRENIAITPKEDQENFLFFKQEIDELREKIENLSGLVMSRESELEQSNELVRMLEKKLSSNETELKEAKSRLYRSEEELEEFIKEFDGATN